jgi:cytochrome c oxidase cbb3-type subunit 3/ubiquinol-cytochrome c reductase cytochrome c subunit
VQPARAPDCGSTGGSSGPGVDFATLFRTHCAGCHGAEGKGGAALALADPLYVAIADDGVLTRAIRDGIPGSLMPAFGRAGGGLLTDDQVTALVRGIRTRWARPGALQGVSPPPYAATSPGDAARGAQVFEVFCSGCHGPGGRGGPKASAADGAYLSWSATRASEPRSSSVDRTSEPRLEETSPAVDVPAEISDGRLAVARRRLPLQPQGPR